MRDERRTRTLALVAFELAVAGLAALIAYRLVEAVIAGAL